MDQEQQAAEQIRIDTMREDFQAVLSAVDNYLAENPHDGPLRPRSVLTPKHRQSVASAVAGAAQLATEQLHEIGYRIVNSFEAYEVLAGRRRIYEYDQLVMQRNVYESIARSVVTEARDAFDSVKESH